MLKKIKMWLLSRKIKKILSKHQIKVPSKCVNCELLFIDMEGFAVCTSEHDCTYATRRINLDDRETKQGVSGGGSKMR